MERRQRFVLFAVVFLLCGQLLWQGHGRSRKETPVAFLHYSTSAVLVRLSGALPTPGIRAFPDGTPLASVINMTHHDSRATVINQEILPSPVAGGDIIHLIRRDRQHIEITITRMKAQERMLLGIPLDVNLMGVQEWDALPGIGPALARAIVSDRQINGEFGSVDDLVRVPGMGKKKLSAIRRFF